MRLDVAEIVGIYDQLHIPYRGRPNREVVFSVFLSRSYYGAFHVACEFLRVLRFRIPASERGHAFVWLRLSNSGHADLIKAGRDLKDLRNRRNAADYQGMPAVTAENADDWLTCAQVIVAHLDAALNDAVRTQIRDAMKTYEKDVLKEVTWQP